MKFSIASIFVAAAAAALAPSIARAGDDITQHKGAVSADFELLPSGTFDGSFGGFNGSSSLDTAYGVGMIFENQIDELVSFGLAPRFLFNVITKNSSGGASSEMDLRARLAVGHDLIPKMRVYGFGEPGYSVIFPPKDSNGNSVHPNGFVIAAGGGLSFALSPTVRAYFELGYQWGFQSYSATFLGQPVSGDFHTSYLQLGFGLSAAVD